MTVGRVHGRHTPVGPDTNASRSAGEDPGSGVHPIGALKVTWVRD